MRLLTLTLCALIACFSAFAQKSYDIVSPDGTLKADVTIADGKITYSVIKDQTILINPSEIAMNLSDGSVYDGSVALQKTRKTTVDQTLDALFYKKAQVRDNYNQLTLSFKTFDLIFRAFAHASVICLQRPSLPTARLNK